MKLSAHAQRLHEVCLVIDTHADSIGSAARKQRPLGIRSNEGHLDFPRMREGGVNVQFLALYIEPAYKPDRGLWRCLQLADVFFREMEQNQQQVELALSIADMDRIIAAGKMACVLSVEGGEALQGDVGVLRMLYRLGVRALGLTWNQRNQLADGVGEQRTGGGLTTAGVAVVEEMNRLGMLIDVSHISEAGFWDVIECSTQPILASHSNARQVCGHLRNLTDDQIRALAQNGGVMGMNFAPEFVDAERATIERVMDHVDHIVTLVGVDHVGLGSDFDGIGATPEGLEDVTCMPRLTQSLLDRGYSEGDIRKILGLNHRRVFSQVWGAAQV